MSHADKDDPRTIRECLEIISECFGPVTDKQRWTALGLILFAICGRLALDIDKDMTRPPWWIRIWRWGLDS